MPDREVNTIWDQAQTDKIDFELKKRDFELKADVSGL